MTDLVVGLGEIGKPLMKLLQVRGFAVHGWDISEPLSLKENYEFINICFQYSEEFVESVKQWKDHGKVVIHSTVKPGTSKELGVVYSPVRGVHSRMFEDLQRYAKYYSGNENVDFEQRFKVCVNVGDSTKLEQTKIIVDTTYYGYLIAFRKIVDKDYDVYWEFATEINAALKNRPVMYNDGKRFGGHCIINNLDLLDKSMITEIIRYSDQ